MTRALLVLLLVATRSLAQAPTYVAHMGLDDVVASTLRHSPTLAQAQGAVRSDQSFERVAVGNFLPSVALNSGYVQSNQIVATPTVGSSAAQNYSAGLAGSLDLFTGGRRGAQITAAQANTRSADASLVSTRYVVALTAQSAFYTVQHARSIVDVGQTTVTNAERALQYVNSQLQSGTATKADLLLAQYNLTVARQQVIAARDTLATASYALGRLVGVDGAVDAVGPDSLPSPTLALSDSVLLALAAHDAPVVKAADQFAVATHADTRAARTEYIPTITLTGGYDWATQSRFNGAVRPGYFVTVGTSFPLFNGFQRENNVEQASVTETVARVQDLDEHRFARAEAARLLSDVRAMWDQLTQATEAVRVTTEDVRVQSARYQSGVATFLDLSTAELNEAQAGVTLALDRQLYLIARASLEALVGRSL
jgi:outer membrane protein